MLRRDSTTYLLAQSVTMFMMAFKNQGIIDQTIQIKAFCLKIRSCFHFRYFAKIFLQFQTDGFCFKWVFVKKQWKSMSLHFIIISNYDDLMKDGRFWLWNDWVNDWVNRESCIYPPKSIIIEIVLTSICVAKPAWFCKYASCVCHLNTIVFLHNNLNNYFVIQRNALSQPQVMNEHIFYSFK